MAAEELMKSQMVAASATSSLARKGAVQALTNALTRTLDRSVETTGIMAAELATVREMVGACWKAPPAALSLLMSFLGREEAVQHVLKCYQAFTQACGALSLTPPRDAFLTLLDKLKDRLVDQSTQDGPLPGGLNLMPFWQGIDARLTSSDFLTLAALTKAAVAVSPRSLARYLIRSVLPLT